MKLFDSHTHLDMEPLSSEFADVIERAAKAGVVGMINVGVSLKGSERSVKIAETYPHIWASVGFHPHDAETILTVSDAVSKLRAITKSDRVVAIGEIGLDYFTSEGEVLRGEKEKQKELFCAQLKLALDLELPVVFHIREAWDDFFEIMESRDYKNIKGVVHCFTGNAKTAKRVIKQGLLVGFTGMVTFKQSKFDHIRETVRTTPIDKILIETDAPFLAPEPYRGKTNEPAHVSYVAEKIAEIKNISASEIAETTTKNAKKLFNI